MGRPRSNFTRVDTLVDSHTLYLSAVLRRLGFLVAYTLWLIPITYIVNVVFNFAELIERSGVGAVFQRSNITHALFIDQTAGLLIELPGYVVPVVLAVIPTAYVVFAVSSAYKVRSQQIQELDTERDSLDVLVREYDDKYGRHIFRNVIVPSLLRRPRPQRPVPSEAEQQSNTMNRQRLRDLGERRAELDKSGQIQHYEQIKEWIKDDDELVDLIDDLVRRRRFFADLRGSTVALVAVAVVSRLLSVLLNR